MHHSSILSIKLQQDLLISVNTWKKSSVRYWASLNIGQRNEYRDFWKQVDLRLDILLEQKSVVSVTQSITSLLVFMRTNMGRLPLLFKDLTAASSIEKGVKASLFHIALPDISKPNCWEPYSAFFKKNIPNFFKILLFAQSQMVVHSNVQTSLKLMHFAINSFQNLDDQINSILLFKKTNPDYDIKLWINKDDIASSYIHLLFKSKATQFVHKEINEADGKNAMDASQLSNEHIEQRKKRMFPAVFLDIVKKSQLLHEDYYVAKDRAAYTFKRMKGEGSLVLFQNQIINVLRTSLPGTQILDLSKECLDIEPQWRDIYQKIYMLSPDSYTTQSILKTLITHQHGGIFIYPGTLPAAVDQNGNSVRLSLAEKQWAAQVLIGKEGGLNAQNKTKAQTPSVDPERAKKIQQKLQDGEISFQTLPRHEMHLSILDYQSLSDGRTDSLDGKEREVLFSAQKHSMFTSMMLQNTKIKWSRILGGFYKNDDFSKLTEPTTEQAPLFPTPHDIFWFMRHLSSPETIVDNLSFKHAYTQTRSALFKTINPFTKFDARHIKKEFDRLLTQGTQKTALDFMFKSPSSVLDSSDEIFDEPLHFKKQAVKKKIGVFIILKPQTGLKHLEQLVEFMQHKQHGDAKLPVCYAIENKLYLKKTQDTPSGSGDDEFFAAPVRLKKGVDRKLYIIGEGFLTSTEEGKETLLLGEYTSGQIVELIKNNSSSKEINQFENIRVVTTSFNQKEPLRSFKDASVSFARSLAEHLSVSNFFTALSVGNYPQRIRLDGRKEYYINDQWRHKLDGDPIEFEDSEYKLVFDIFNQQAHEVGTPEIEFQDVASEFAKYPIFYGKKDHPRFIKKSHQPSSSAIKRKGSLSSAEPEALVFKKRRQVQRVFPTNPKSNWPHTQEQRNLRRAYHKVLSRVKTHRRLQLRLRKASS